MACSWVSIGFAMSLLLIAEWKTGDSQTHIDSNQTLIKPEDTPETTDLLT